MNEAVGVKSEGGSNGPLPETVKPIALFPEGKGVRVVVIHPLSAAVSTALTGRAPRLARFETADGE